MVRCSVRTIAFVISNLNTRNHESTNTKTRKYKHENTKVRRRKTARTKTRNTFKLIYYRVFAIVFSHLRHRTLVFSSSYFRIFVIVLSFFRVFRLLNKNAMALTEYRKDSDKKNKLAKDKIWHNKEKFKHSSINKSWIELLQTWKYFGFSQLIMGYKQTFTVKTSWCCTN